MAYNSLNNLMNGGGKGHLSSSSGGAASGSASTYYPMSSATPTYPPNGGAAVPQPPELGKYLAMASSKASAGSCKASSNFYSPPPPIPQPQKQAAPSPLGGGSSNFRVHMPRPAAAAPPPPRRDPFRLPQSHEDTQYDLSKQMCVVCEKQMTQPGKEQSFVVFGACLHTLHLKCAMSTLNAKASEEHLNGGPDSACALCTKEQLRRGEIARGMRKTDEVNRDRARLITQFKNQYRVEHNGQSFDELVQKPLSDAEVREMLRLPSSSSSSRKSLFKSTLSVLAPSKLLSDASSFVASVRGSEAHAAAAEAPSDDEGGEQSELERAIDTGNFNHAARVAGRSFSDIMATERGSLVNLYRVGVQSLGQLNELGFDPQLHVRKHLEKKVPLWQLCALYDLKFTDLIIEGMYNMTVRDLASNVHAHAAEWSLLGADAQSLLSLGMTARDMRRMDLTLSRWQRYLLLEERHLRELGITTKQKYKEMRWESDHEWFNKLA